MIRTCFLLSLLLAVAASESKTCDPATETCEGQEKDVQSILQTQVGVKRDHAMEEEVQNLEDGEATEDDEDDDEDEDEDEDDDDEDDEVPLEDASSLDSEVLAEVEEEDDDVVGLDDRGFHSLLYGMPLVLSNISNYTALFSTQTQPRIEVTHKFGDLASDTALLQSHVEGFMTMMQEEVLGEDDDACASDSVLAINGCLSRAMCLMQFYVDGDDVPDQKDLKKFALLEEMYTRFQDMTWPQTVSMLALTEKYDPKKPVEYMTPDQHSCDADEAWDKSASDSLLEMSTELAAAYRTSSALVDTAKATHAIMDAHNHNSSVDATAEALHAIWKPTCELLGCDGTNYRDLWRASHAHSSSLLEMGASARHMQVHIRTRQRMELRMQQFLGEHGVDLGSKVHEDLATTWRSAPKQYFAQSRGAFVEFAVQYPLAIPVSTRVYPLRLFDGKKLEQSLASEGASDVLDTIRGDEAKAFNEEYAYDNGNDDIDDEEDDANLAMVETDNEHEYEDEEEDLRGGDIRLGKGILNTVSNAVNSGVQAANDAAKQAEKAWEASIAAVPSPVKEAMKKGFDKANAYAQQKGRTAAEWTKKQTNKVDKRFGIATAASRIGKGVGKFGGDAWNGFSDNFQEGINGIVEFDKQSGINAINKAGKLSSNFKDKLKEASKVNYGKMLKDTGNDIARVSKGWANKAADAAQSVGDFIMSLFACLGSFSEGYAYGYGFKVPTDLEQAAWKIWPMGAAFSIGLTVKGIGMAAGIAELLNGKTYGVGLALAMSIVIGAVPGNAETGGVRVGIGVSAGFGCQAGEAYNGKPDCNVGLVLGAMGSALIPSTGCIGPMKIGPAGCFFGYGIMVSIMCCQYWIISGSGDCR